MSSLAETGSWSPSPSEAHPTGRTPPDVLFAEAGDELNARVHRIFFWGLGTQAAVALGAALATPARGSSRILLLACAALCALPGIAAVLLRPRERPTRFTIALSQAALLVLLHHAWWGLDAFPAFGFAALAALALYREPPVVALAAGILVLDTFFGAKILGHGPDFTPGSAGAIVTALGFIAEAAALGWMGNSWSRETRRRCEAQNDQRRLAHDLEARVHERTRLLAAEIAEREKMAGDLRRKEQHHRELVARIPIGIFETTRSGQVRFANPYLLSLIGLPPKFDATILNVSDGRIFPVPDRERLWHRLENEGEVRGFTARLRHFDGSSFDVIINGRLKPQGVDDELVCEGTIEDVSVRKRAEQELEGLHNQLMLASRQAGMAEVATGVLHNVGNVLTSVNLIVHDVQDRLKTTRLSHLHRVVEIMQREQARLGEFITQDPTGKQLPDFLAKLDAHLASENRQLLTDVEGLVRHFEHIREIIVTQQGSAQLFGVIETMAAAQLFEDALRLNAESLERHGIALERAFDGGSLVRADRHKVLQILVNLLKNARDALQVVKPGERIVRVQVSAPGPDLVALSVEDNGPGIATENLTRIFQHGYTTKPGGHGFGLHSSVLAAREMDGDLVVASAGPGKGCTFTLTLPRADAS